jgi:hypothetical protein
MVPALMVNEYMRRDERFSAIVVALIFLPTIVVAGLFLSRAQGPMIQDPAKVALERKLAEQVKRYKTSRCEDSAAKIQGEFDLLVSRDKQAKREANEAAAKSARTRVRPGKGQLDYTTPWGAAKPVLAYAKKLRKGGCKKQTRDVVGKNAKAHPGWRAILKVAKLSSPGKDKKAQQLVARKILRQLRDAPLKAVGKHAKKATKRLKARRAAAKKTKEKSLVRAQLAEGLFSRTAALILGIGVALAALVLSFFSLWSASNRRAKTLVSLRRFANTPERGLQAAAIVRLAGHHNGGEPGMVLGASIGALLASFLTLTDFTDDPNIFVADLFVAGAMGGLLIGLAAQWLSRTLGGASKWRERAKELGDIEKPTIPVALILGGVMPGLEDQFLSYFEDLSFADAGIVVEKLAAQAEEQILAAADAAAEQAVPPMQHAGAPGASPWGGGPGA